LTAIAEAERTGCDLAAACVLLVKESSGGKNLWGRDGTPVPDSELPYDKGGYVTERNYTAYKAARSRIGMQGCGPCQLTWYFYQDDADEIGGCWQPQYNCRIGFGLLAGFIAGNGFRAAFGQYNGGPNWRDDEDAVEYADKAMALLPKWQEIVAG
jgi:hypothetical protein